MKRPVSFLAAAAVVLLGLPLAAQPAPNAPDAMSSVRYLVGTWACAHTVGDFSGTYSTTFAPVLDGRWLKQTFDFPATGNEPAIHAEYFLGYEPRVPRWVRFGAHSNGMYFAMKTTAASDTTWTWSYVLPGTTGTATWTKRSDREFAIDGPEYPQGGKLVTEHHVCKKAS